MKMVIVTILSRWEIEPIDPQSVKPVRKGAVLSPAKELRMRLTGLRSQKQFIVQARSE